MVKRWICGLGFDEECVEFDGDCVGFRFFGLELEEVR